MLFFVFVFFFLIVMPTILGSLAIVTDHRRKMAALHAEALSKDAGRVEALERRVAELAALVHEQTIMLDSVSAQPLQERVEQQIGR